MIFKFQFNIIKKLSKYLIFSNTYLEAKKSNLYFQNFKDKIEIYSTNQDIIVKDLYKASYDLYKILKKNKLIFPVYKNFFPGIGSDVHYFNTIPNSSNKILGVNRIGKLNNENGIFIVDGSVINSHSYKFPTGLIMANANRIGSEI